MTYIRNYGMMTTLSLLILSITNIMISFKTLIHFALPKKSLTAFAGFMANIRIPLIKNYLIRDFIKTYQVNMSEALCSDPTAYTCFNDFFIRRLQPAYRPIATTPIVSPVDGCISELGRIEAGTLLQAKGKSYQLHELLASERKISDAFMNGHFVTIYLSPKDYHRVHMPIDGFLQSMTYVPGRLFSVQPHTVQTIPNLFAHNERLVVFFETQIGLMAMVLVGATLVGAIGTAWHGDIQRTRTSQSFDYPQKTLLKKADEMGYFKLGSTVILLFANAQQVAWYNTLSPGSSLRYGEALASIS